MMRRTILLAVLVWFLALPAVATPVNPTAAIGDWVTSIVEFLEEALTDAEPASPDPIMNDGNGELGLSLEPDG